MTNIIFLYQSFHFWSIGKYGPHTDDSIQCTMEALINWENIKITTKNNIVKVMFRVDWNSFISTVCRINWTLTSDLTFELNNELTWLAMPETPVCMCESWPIYSASDSSSESSTDDCLWPSLSAVTDDVTVGLLTADDFAAVTDTHKPTNMIPARHLLTIHCDKQGNHR